MITTSDEYKVEIAKPFYRVTSKITLDFTSAFLDSSISVDEGTFGDYHGTKQQAYDSGVRSPARRFLLSNEPDVVGSYLNGGDIISGPDTQMGIVSEIATNADGEFFDIDSGSNLFLNPRFADTSNWASFVSDAPNELKASNNRLFITQSPKTASAISVYQQVNNSAAAGDKIYVFAKIVELTTHIDDQGDLCMEFLSNGQSVKTTGYEPNPGNNYISDILTIPTGIDNVQRLYVTYDLSGPGPGSDIMRKMVLDAHDNSAIYYINLTDTFGAGNEPTTAAECEALYIYGDTGLYFDINFSSRTVKFINVFGDSFRDTHAVNFTLQLYYGAAWHLETTVTGNTLCNYKYTPPVPRTEVTKARLTITKWSEVHALMSILEFSISRIETYTTANFISWNMLEELYAAATKSLPIGNISYNEFEVILDDPGDIPVSERRKNVQASVELGVLVEGSYEYIPLGTFYAKFWSVDETDSNLRLVARDLLSIMSDEPPMPSEVYIDKTAYYLLDLLFAASQLRLVDYYVDTAFLDITIPLAYLEGSNKVEQLQRIIQATLGNINTTRKAVIQAMVDITIGSSVRELYSGADIQEGESTPMSEQEVATAVTVNWYEFKIAASATNVVTSSSVITIPAGETKEIFIGYNIEGDTVTEVETPTFTGGADISLTDWEAYYDNLYMLFTNTGTTTQTITQLDADGKIITKIKHSVSDTNTAQVALYGLTYYTLDNILIQDETTALTLLETILNEFADPERYREFPTLGDPSLEIKDTITKPAGVSTEDIIIIRQEHDYSGGYDIDITGRTIA